MTAPPAAFETEDFLEVGLAAILVTHFQNTEPRKCMTAIRGWRAGSFVLVDRPRTKEGAEAIIAVGTPCKIRLISNGQACEFDSKVMDIDTGTPTGEIRLRWPNTVRRTAFRKFERVTVKSTCKIETPEGTALEGGMLDVSVGGFSFVTKTALEKESELTVAFTLPDGAHVVDGSAIVRSVNKTDSGILVGCQFKPDQPMIENEVAYFVSTWLRQFRAHGAVAPPPRLLVLDAIGGPVETQQVAFQKAGVETLLASNIVDAAYRIRVSHPLALVINDEMPNMDSAALMSLLSGGPKEYCLPVYLSKNGEVSRFDLENGKATANAFKTSNEDAATMAKAILGDLKVARD